MSLLSFQLITRWVPGVLPPPPPPLTGLIGTPTIAHGGVLTIDQAMTVDGVPASTLLALWIWPAVPKSLQFNVCPEATDGAAPKASEARQSRASSPLALVTVTLAGEPAPVVATAVPSGAEASTPVNEIVPTMAELGVLEKSMLVFAVVALVVSLYMA